MADFTKYTDEELENKAVELYYADDPDNNLVSAALKEGYQRDNALIKSLVADAVYNGSHGMEQNQDLAWTLANDAFAQGMPLGAYVLAQIYIDRKDCYLGELLLEQVKDVLPAANDMWTGLQELKKNGFEVEPVDYLPMNGHNLVDALNYYTVLTWADKGEGYRGVAEILKHWPCFAKSSKPADWYEKGALCKDPDPKCQYKLACRYTNEKRHKEAFDLYMKAYEGGYDKAAVQIAYSLWFGIGTKKKEKEAVKYFTEAIKCGYINAEYAYKNFFGDASKLYNEAEKLYKENDDAEEAVSKYIEAYNAGNPMAAYKLADIFSYTARYEGNVHILEAKKWIEKFLETDGFDNVRVHNKAGIRPYAILATCYSVEYYMSITGEIDTYSGDCFRKAAECFEKDNNRNSAARMMVCDAMISASSVLKKKKLNDALDYIYKIYSRQDTDETDRIYILFGQDITDESVFGKYKVERAKTVFSRLKARIEKYGWTADYLLAGEYYLAVDKTDQAVAYLEKGAKGYGQDALNCKMLLGYAMVKNKTTDLEKPEGKALYDKVMDYCKEMYKLPNVSGQPRVIFTESLISGIVPWFWYDAESQANVTETVNSHIDKLDRFVKWSSSPHFYITTMARLILRYNDATSHEKVAEANKLLQLAHWCGGIEAAFIRSKGECFGVKLDGSNVVETSTNAPTTNATKQSNTTSTVKQQPASTQNVSRPRPPRITPNSFPVLKILLFIIGITAVVLVRRMDQMSFRSITEEEAVEMAQEVKVSLPDQEIRFLDSDKTQKLKPGTKVKVLGVYKQQLNKGNSPRVYWTNQQYLMELPDGTRAYGPLMETAIGQRTVLAEGDTAVIKSVKKLKKASTVQATGKTSKFDYAYTLEEREGQYALEDLHIYFPQRVAYLGDGLHEEDFLINNDSVAEDMSVAQRAKKFFFYDIRPVTKKQGFFVFPKYQVWNEFYIQRWFRSIMIFLAYVLEIILIVAFVRFLKNDVF